MREVVASLVAVQLIRPSARLEPGSSDSAELHFAANFRTRGCVVWMLQDSIVHAEAGVRPAVAAIRAAR
jgi:hypothetical protein